MTLAAVWYRQKFDELWCAADSRISSGNAILTEMGPKILPVPIVCHRKDRCGHAYTPRYQFTVGFAYAGATLAANSTHALLAACTQNLRTEENAKPIRLESIARLLQALAKGFIMQSPDPKRYCFDAILFGYCHAEKRYRAFAVVPNDKGKELIFLIGDLNLAPGAVHTIGTGTSDFERLSKEMGDPGTIIVMREMLKRQTVPDVGGHFQIGVADRRGFSPRPILNIDGSDLDRKLTFLGWDVNSVGLLDGYGIGFQAVSPHVD